MPKLRVSPAALLLGSLVVAVGCGSSEGADDTPGKPTGSSGTGSSARAGGAGQSGAANAGGANAGSGAASGGGNAGSDGGSSSLGGAGGKSGQGGGGTFAGAAGTQSAGTAGSSGAFAGNGGNPNAAGAGGSDPGAGGGAGSTTGTGLTMPANNRCKAPAGGPVAFPCAEGFGAKTPGGRGGDVYHVTNLNDSGSGSLREGINSASGPRTIVFDTGGTISLKSTLNIGKSNLTIAGQTAPGDGITLRDYSLDLKNARDVVVRFIRIRRGDVVIRKQGKPKGSVGLDSVSIDDSKHVIFDHVSVSWSCDELFGIVQNQNVTVQWSLLAEPLGDPPLHPYGDEHAYGMNNSATTLSVHHNLIAKYVMRGPQFEANDATNSQGFDVLMESVNNVLFDYERSGSRYTAGIETNPSAASKVDFRFHFLNNFYLRNPSRKGPEIQAELKHGVTDQLKLHVAGNIGPLRPKDSLDPWLSVVTTAGDPIASAPTNVKNQRSNVPLFTPPVPVTMVSAAEAYTAVMGDSGASRTRDGVDTRVIADIKAKKYTDYLHSQAEVGGWPTLAAGSAPIDTDKDGMPDQWETDHGLDPKNPADRNGDADGDGYTNLEVFLESLVPAY